MSQVIISILLLSCQEKGFNVPGGTNSQSTEEDSSSPNSIDCAEQWEQSDEGVWYDPVTCVAWSTLSDAITWHETVSASEARDGGCDQFCDLDEDQDYCHDVVVVAIALLLPRPLEAGQGPVVEAVGQQFF